MLIIRKIKSNNSSTITGVSFSKKKQKWIATFTSNKKKHQSKYYEHFITAVIVRAKFEKEFGSYLDSEHSPAQQYIKLKNDSKKLIDNFIEEKCVQGYTEDIKFLTPENVIYDHFRKYCIDQIHIDPDKVLTEKQFFDFALIFFSLEFDKGIPSYLHIDFKD